MQPGISWYSRGSVAYKFGLGTCIHITIEANFVPIIVGRNSHNLSFTTFVLTEILWCCYTKVMVCVSQTKYIVVEFNCNFICWRLWKSATETYLVQTINTCAMKRYKQSICGLNDEGVSALTKDTPYLAYTGKLWGCLLWRIGKNWPHYNGIAL